MGCDTLAIKHIARTDISAEHKQAIHKVLSKIVLIFTLIVGLLVSTVLYVISISEGERNIGSGEAIFIGIAVMMMAWYYFALGVVRGFKDIKTYAMYQNIWPILSTLVVAMIVDHLVGKNISTFGLLVIFVIVHFFILFKLSSHIAKYKKKNYKKDLTQRLGIVNTLLEGGPIMLTALTGVLFSYVDTLILSFYKTVEDVAILDIAIKFSALSTLVLLAVNAYIAPQISELHSGARIIELKRIIYRFSLITFWATLPLAFVGFIFAPQLLSIYGDYFVVGTTALRLLVVAQFFSAMCGPVSVLLQLTGNQKAFQWIFGLSLCVNVVLNFLLIPGFGVNGAAFATFVTTIMWNVLAVVLAVKRTSVVTVHYPFKKLEGR